MLQPTDLTTLATTAKHQLLNSRHFAVASKIHVSRSLSVIRRKQVYHI